MLTGSDSAPAKANEAKQKNDIGTARDDVYLTAQNAQMEAYQIAYVENGVSAGDTSTTVGNYVRTKLYQKYGTDGNFKTGLTTITATENGNLEISTTDFVIEGEVATQGGNLTWGEIEPNVPRISNMPGTLSLDTNSTYTINAVLKGTSGNISWSSNKPTIASVSNGVITTSSNITNTTEQVTITASATGCKSKTCILTVTKTMPYAKNVLLLTNNVSPFVNYTDKNGNTILCRVLYNDVNEENTHGLQLISALSVDNVVLGKGDINYTTGTDLQKAQNSYNNAIENLNNKSESYLNSNLAYDSRCVGSVATVTNNKFMNKNDDELLTNPNSYGYLQTYVSNNFKGADTHYGTDNNTDYTKMEQLDIRRGTEYWLASRFIDSNNNGTDFSIRYITVYGALQQKSLFNTYKNVGVDSGGVDISRGFRPVFLIKPTTKISSGAGTSNNPYTLEAGE